MLYVSEFEKLQDENLSVFQDLLDFEIDNLLKPEYLSKKIILNIVLVFGKML